MLFTVLVFLGLLLVLVLVHELGHFIVARIHGMRVEEFGFGFPPRIGGVKRGDTLYSLNWVPLGGFVRIKGENGDTVESDSFAGQKPWRRATVLLAGVGMNVLLAWVLFSVLLGVGVPMDVEGGVAKGAIIGKEELTIVGLFVGGPAAEAGIATGDVLLTVNGSAASGVEELRSIASRGGSVAFEVRRDGDVRTFTVVPKALEEGGKLLTGIQIARIATVRLPLIRAIIEGSRQVWHATGDIFTAFGRVFSGLFSTGHLTEDLAGPVGIAVITGQVARQGWMQILQFAAFLSLNLAILNIIPFPALDGGRLFFVVVEKLRGRPHRARTESLVHQIGFIALLIFVVLVTYRDIVRLGGGG